MHLKRLKNHYELLKLDIEKSSKTECKQISGCTPHELVMRRINLILSLQMSLIRVSLLSIH